MSREANLRKEIGKRLKQARESANYSSVEDFCQKNELPLNPYLSHEEGKTAITVSKAVNYSKLLSISLQWLMLG